MRPDNFIIIGLNPISINRILSSNGEEFAIYWVRYWKGLVMVQSGMSNEEVCRLLSKISGE